MIEPWKKKSFTEIGKRLGVSHQRVQHIHARMLIKLRSKLSEDPLVRDWLIDRGVDPEEMLE